MSMINEDSLIIRFCPLGCTVHENYSKFSTNNFICLQLTEKSFAKNRNSAPDFDKQEVGKGRLYLVS